MNATRTGTGGISGFNLGVPFALAVATLMAACATVAEPAQQNVGPPLRDADITKDPTYAWGELQMAISPANPDHIAYATVGVTICGERTTGDCEQLDSQFYPPVPGMPANFMSKRQRGFYENPDFTAIYVYHSEDGGRTWDRSRLPLHPKGLPTLFSQGDPGLTAGPDGTLYASWDANDWGTPEKTLPAAGVAVSVSRDNGHTWSEPVLSGVPVDGPKVVADVITGDVYVAASTFRGSRSTGDPSVPLDPTNDRWLVRSKDGVHFTETHGMGGFGAQMTAAHGIFATAFNTTSMNSPFASPNNQLCGDRPAPCTIFETTQDAGVSWSRHVVPVELPKTSFPSPGSMPMIAADPTQKGRFSIGVPVGPSFHVYTTTDGGETWSEPTIVTIDPERVPFHSSMAYSRQGVLGIVTRSRAKPVGAQIMMRPPPAPYNVWAAISRDKGETFSEPLKISGSDSPAGDGIGDDYSHLVMGPGYLYAGWADWRPGTRSGYFAAVPFSDFKF